VSERVTFVVLDLPSFAVLVVVLPVVVLWNSKEGVDLVSFRALDDWSDKLLQETVDFEQ
jgi:hypothetical protein